MKLTYETWDKVFKAKVSSIETMELKGYTLIEELFADSSGFGQDDEPALSVSQFEMKVKSLLAQHGTLTAKITSVGQFQCYVGLFKKTGEAKCKKIANNTLLIDYENGKRAVRLHETDIITEDKENGKLILDNGGYYTRTTKDRLNRYLPMGYYISQEKGEWYVYGTGFGKLQYHNGMALTGVINL